MRSRPAVAVGVGVVTLSGQRRVGLVRGPRGRDRGVGVPASAAGTSTSAMYDPPSGASRIVAGPRTLERPARRRDERVAGDGCLRRIGGDALGPARRRRASAAEADSHRDNECEGDT